MEKQTVAHQNPQLPQDELVSCCSCVQSISRRSVAGIERDGINDIVGRIEKFGEFRYRSEMEHDVNYKQIIPYLVFSHQHKYF